MTFIKKIKGDLNSHVFQWDHQAQKLWLPKKPSEKIIIKILYIICVPMLLYACNVKEYSCSENTDFNTAVNNAVRKIHSFD